MSAKNEYPIGSNKREKRVNIRLSASEFAQVEAASGSKELSTWVREQALSAMSQPLAQRLSDVEVTLQEVLKALASQATATEHLRKDIGREVATLAAIVTETGLKTDSFFQSPDPRVDALQVALQVQISSLTSVLKNAHKLHEQQLANILARLS